MLWVHPGTRLRIKLNATIIPEGKQKLIVGGIYLGGDMKSNTSLILGSNKLPFTENDGNLFIETDFEANAKWSFIVAPFRDYILINYIALRNESGETIIMDSRVD